MIISNIPFNVLRSEEFIAACAKIAEHGPGYVPPSSETARTKILAKLKEEVNEKTVEYISQFISSGIEEIGPSNVVQFVTDNASNYIAAGYMIEQKYPHIVKTSCAAYCLDLILEDIDEVPLVKSTLENARKIVKFKYKYQQVLDLMRSHTDGRELKRP
ncbi:UNVERIFIED_CONTAM: hypothetical protein Slati_0074800, partial [Sesamum latifolium]